MKLCEARHDSTQIQGSGAKCAHGGFPCNPVFFCKSQHVHQVFPSPFSCWGNPFRSIFPKPWLCRFWKRSPSCQISRTGKPNSRSHHPLTWANAPSSPGANRRSRLYLSGRQRPKTAVRRRQTRSYSKRLRRSCWGWPPADGQNGHNRLPRPPRTINAEHYFRVLGSAVCANGSALPLVAPALQQIGHELSHFVLLLLCQK